MLPLEVILMKIHNTLGDAAACLLPHHGPVVQSIVSLTSSLRGQLIKCFITLLPNTLIFFIEKMREAFAVQKLLTFSQQKIVACLRY